LQYKQLMESHFLFHQSYFTKCHWSGLRTPI
jgi:hypothetical protein